MTCRTLLISLAIPHFPPGVRLCLSILGAGGGIRTPDLLLGKPAVDTFVNIRKATKGLTKQGEKWLRYTLGKFVECVPLPVNQVTNGHIITSLAQYEDKPWRRHSLYRALNTFFRWASEEYHFDNPMARIQAPKTPDVVLYAITPDKTAQLIEDAGNTRDKAIIALLADSGARRSEIAGIKADDLDLEHCRIKVLGKGNKEGYLVFGAKTKALLTQYINEANPTGNLFDLNTFGIQTMLRRLGEETGIKCNAHAFRRGFATSLRRAGVGELDIQQLGRWSSLEMVHRYTKSYTFDDAAKRYKPIVT